MTSPASTTGRAARALVGTLLALTTGLTTAVVAELTVASPAGATISRLCYGFNDCADKGYGNFGYRSKIGTMWWRMYSGHNCTNYAAYRMVRSGMSTTRPWSGSGNATNWGYAMSRITDQTPTVGAVAWWKAYAPGAGSSGHVAVVEQVISKDKIVVSQDSWGGDFSWAVITRSGSGWPTGFVHFNDQAMKADAQPAIEGPAKVGATLSTDGGAWSPGDPELTYQWRRGRKAIAGATAPTYTVSREDRNRRIRVKVTATQSGYSTTTATSPFTSRVAAGELAAATPPAVSGTPAVGQALTAAPATWNITPDSVTYRWLAAGQPVPGATGPTWTPAPAQLGQRIQVEVTASKQGYADVTSRSPATTRVARGTLTQGTPPTIAGRPRLGQSLTLDPGSVVPEATGQETTTVQWLRGGVAIPGATGTTYAVTAADLGSALSATVTHTRAGYTDLTGTTVPTAPARSVATLALRARRPVSGDLRVTGTVTAPEVVPPAGSVQLKRRNRVLATAALVNGAFDIELDGNRAGQRRYRVVYLGSRSTTRARSPIRLKVR